MAGLVWINLDASTYRSVWGQVLEIGPGRRTISEDLQGWVNDGLMTLFFFGVGLEIKRELVVGELRDRRRAALPVIAALGGMVVPAAVYLLTNAVTTSGDTSGWAIPVATDIAFTLGVLALLGDKVPVHLRLFVLTLAIVDDVGGVLIIAFGFSEGVNSGYLAAAGTTLVLVGLQRLTGSSSPVAYMPLGLILWYFLAEAGVEPTIAGVALGLATPAFPVKGRAVLQELEERLMPVTSLLVLPLFALANTGIEIDGEVISETARSPISLGVVLGLVAGKAIGITVASGLALRLGIGTVHESVDTRLIAPVAILAGIGFTVSLFIAELTFSDSSQLDQAKLGILAGSVLAGTVGTLAYRRAHQLVTAEHACTSMDHPASESPKPII